MRLRDWLLESPDNPPSSGSSSRDFIIGEVVNSRWQTFSLPVLALDSPTPATILDFTSPIVPHGAGYATLASYPALPFQLIIDLSSCDFNDRFYLVTHLRYNGAGSVLPEITQIHETFKVTLEAPSPGFGRCIILEGPAGKLNLGPSSLLIYKSPELLDAANWSMSVLLAQTAGMQRQLRYMLTLSGEVA